MYKLFVSYSCGIDYHEEIKSENIEDLRPRMEKCDKEMLRYYVEKDGEQDFEEMCNIHRSIIGIMSKLNRR